MGCGCRKSNMRTSRSISGPRQQAALKPVSKSTQNIIVPPQKMQDMSQTTSQTPPAPRSPSGEYMEKRKIQQIRRNAIRKAFGR